MTELLERAESMIVASSGVTDWRPLFVLGLQSLIVMAVAVAILVWIVWKSLR